MLTPVMVNDNLIDIMIEPGPQGSPASVDWRPRSSAYHVESLVSTAAKGGEANVTMTNPSPGVIRVEGEVPAGGGQVIRTFTVQDPASFGRTVFIEALQRAGVWVGAQPVGPNNPSGLPAGMDYKGDRQVAVLKSPPLSEYVKMILKVSHNPGADTLLMLIGSKNGGHPQTMADGLALEKKFLADKARVDVSGLILNDGQGSPGADYASASAMVQLLRYMSTRPDFKEYRAALPILGVDGTLATLLKNSPAAGKVHAKTGTHVSQDGLNQRLIVSRCLGGYMTTKSGKELAFDVAVSNVGARDMSQLATVNEKHGRIMEILYEEY